MAIRIVRLGSKRDPHEGVRIGTVRYPPRGVPKQAIKSRNFYDVRLAALAPSATTLKLAREAVRPDEWRRFRRRFLAEMKRPEPKALLDFLAILSRTADFSIGCYCEDETRCHRSLLKELLMARKAKFARA